MISHFGSRIATRLLAVLVLTCSVSRSTSTTATDSRPIKSNSRMGHKKIQFKFVWPESLFKNNFNPKCVAPVSPSQQLEQNRYSELIQVMGKAVRE
jgi:hypothetical protein